MIGNAVEAVCGARIKILPLTPERVWRGLAGKWKRTVGHSLGG
jgi:hypothetical protein